jgi:polyhydroxyalkanoate synthesis regulator phasin
MKKILRFSMGALVILLMGSSVTFVSAVTPPEIPKPTVPSAPGVPSPPAAAPAAPATIDQKIEVQQKKIDLGLKSKLFTQAETTTLQNNLKYIKNREKRLKADGSLSPKDVEWLSILLDHNGKMIDNKKANPIQAMKDIYYQMRFEQHQKWIEEGIASGELTKDEAKEVRDDLSRIKAKHAQLDKDGKLTPDERERLDDMLSRNTRMITKRMRNPEKK